MFLGDGVDVQQLARGVRLAFDLDAERLHYGDSHVDIRLRDDLTAGQLKRNLFGGIRSAEQYRRNVLRGDGRCQLNARALKPSWSDGERETALRFEVLDGGVIGAKGVYERTDGVLFHPGVTSDNGGGCELGGLDESADGGEEASGGTSVSEVDLLAFGRNGEGSFAAMDDERLSTVFPFEAGTLQPISDCREEIW